MQDINIKRLLKQDKARIRWVNYGVANSFAYNYKGKEYKIIELNKALIDEPDIFYPILFHELRHSKKILAIEDVINDFSFANLKSLPNFKIIAFMLKNPSALIQVLPVYKTKKQGWVFDINLCLLWLVGLFMAFFLIKFVAKI